MYQIGLMAAAAIFALDNNLEKIKVDHARTKELIEGGFML